ncbi:MAG: putative LPS assembly protein LptD, partial [Proteobacteria bacterium]|nr:putative LPS assembly protein LptD [Pseudomonadota bacterium]
MNGFYAVIGKSLQNSMIALFVSSLGLLIGVPLLRGEAARVPELGAAHKPMPSLDSLDLDPDYSFLYDARTIGLDKSGQRYMFEGDVILIGGGNVITADIIRVDYLKSEITAEGHVIFLHQNEVFTGERVQIQWKTSDFHIESAVLVASDTRKVEDVSRRILGQSAHEIAYEAARSARLNAMSQKKELLKKEFRLSISEQPSREQVADYTQLLEQERMTREASAPTLADRDPGRRRRLERRRAYWLKSRAAAAAEFIPQSYYFRLSGKTLERKDGNLYKADVASFTPCRCEDDEFPAWSFQADTIEAQQEGYIDLKHPVLTIKGIPVLYLPFLKLPLKAKRQSGFLMPSFQSGTAKNGFVYTQPVFFDLAKNSDATITADVFQKRGTRVAVETRYEARKSSGFRYQTEVIRDNSWLLLGSQREELIRYHLIEKPYCTDPDPLVRQTCEQQKVRDYLEVPGNTWRGKHEWQGRYFLAPRLSIVSNGKLVSDHRYLQDLYLSDDVASAFFADQANANAFSTSKLRLDFDGQDFYAGIGGSYGDNTLATESFVGQQMPAYFNFQTRLFRLFPASLIDVPSYVELQAKTISIDQWEGKKPPINVQTVKDPQLGGGNWQRFALDLTTPLANQGIIRVDHFAEGELRVINHRDLPEQSSTIRSWRTGLTLNLPIDGQGPLPSWLRHPEQGDGTSYVRHIMNWSLGFSTRPSVVRDGPYGEITDSNGAPLVYFPSDRKRFYAEDRDVRDEEMMIPHQRITLGTTQRWQVFDRIQEILPAQVPPEEKAKQDLLQDLHEQALRELRSVKDQRPTSTESMFREHSTGSVDWYINRYRVSDSNLSEPVSFSANMSYDHAQEKLRQEQIRLNKELESQALDALDPIAAESIRKQKVSYYALPESWLGPYANLLVSWRGFSLSTTSNYNIYRNSNTSLSYALGLPMFMKTSVGLAYVLEKSPELDTATGSLLFKRIKTSNFSLNTALVPYVNIGANLIRKQVEDQKIQYGTSYQIAYDGISGCWGLRFVREKDLNQDERN